MNLPHRYLADLPADYPLTPALIRDACIAVRRNRERYLAAQTTGHLIQVLLTVADCWRSPDFPLRQQLAGSSPDQTGFTAPVLLRGLDAFFAQFTEPNLRALIAQDLGHPNRLDAWTASQPEAATNRSAIARGPALLVHIGGGRLPLAMLSSLTLGLLARSAQFLKCPSSHPNLVARLFAHSIHQIDHHAGACIEIASWPGGQTDLDDALVAQADRLTATGSDETIAAIRNRLPPRLPFVPHGHAVSFAYLSREALSSVHWARLARAAATDIADWDQAGCLSPQVLYLEAGGTVDAPTFAEKLAQSLDQLETDLPRAPLDLPTAAAIASRRSFYQVRAAHSVDTRVWTSPNSTAWTVVLDSDPHFQSPPPHRFIHLKVVASIEEALRGADPVRGRVSTVALAASDARAESLAHSLARWGVPRICSLGQMQSPPLAWRHDGRPALADLVEWTDWELP